MPKVQATALSRETDTRQIVRVEGDDVKLLSEALASGDEVELDVGRCTEPFPTPIAKAKVVSQSLQDSVGFFTLEGEAPKGKSSSADVPQPSPPPAPADDADPLEGLGEEGPPADEKPHHGSKKAKNR